MGPGRFAVRFGPGPLDLTPLDLTAEQKQKIQDMRKKVGAHAKQIHKQLKEEREQLRDMMFGPDASEAQLKAKHSEIRKLQEQAEGIMFENFLAIRRLLTPEQKKHLPEVKPPPRPELPRPGLAGPGAQEQFPPGGPGQPRGKPKEDEL
jgi:Spy/CpxP family protein refolding chaperone